jgi:hypothetical protein
VSHPLGDDFTGSQDIVPQVFNEESVLKYTSNVQAVASSKTPAYKARTTRSWISLRTGAITGGATRCC